VTAEHYTDLVVWQLARELERGVFAFTATGRVRMDRDYCKQIRESAASAPANIAEGFGRFWPAEFAHKLRIARGELYETHDHLLKGLSENYLPVDEANRLLKLANRSIGAATRLLAYLDTHGEEWKKRFRERQKREAAAGNNRPEREQTTRRSEPENQRTKEPEP
jgi:four helix bundle protein